MTVIAFKNNEVNAFAHNEELKHFEYLLTKMTEKIVKYLSDDPSIIGTKNSSSVSSLLDINEPKDLYDYFSSRNLIKTPENGIFNNNMTEIESLNKILEQIDLILDNSVNTWSIGFMEKLYASTNPIGVISDILLSMLNTNTHVFSVSPMLTIIEKKIGKEYAKLFFGDDNKLCGGLTFSGGSWSNITSMQIARSFYFPESKKIGVYGKKLAIFTSVDSHYSVIKSAILLGLGSDSVFKINVDQFGQMSPEHLKQQIELSKSIGFVPFYINLTAGTTVFGAFDPIEEVLKIIKDQNIWCHIDGSLGGNLIFGDKIHQAGLQNIEKVDSITVNPHKLLGTPTTCSFLLLKDERLFELCNSLKAPYLFHNDGEEEEKESFDLASGTLGCGRRSDGLKFYLSWYYYGKEGFKARINHQKSIANYFSTKVLEGENFKKFEVVNFSSSPNVRTVPCVQVCFYYNPFDFEVLNFSSITQFICKWLRNEGKYMIDYSPLTSNNKGKGDFIRIVFINPKLTTSFIDTLIENIKVAGKAYKKDLN